MESHVQSHEWLLLISLMFSDVFKLSGQVTSFQQIVENLFGPLFEVSINPASHPELHLFLQYVRLSTAAQ